ncbi:MAG: amidohydrolase [Ruminococcaceae bacterium]|nr:amidohydrolase [Oscillospiraceae bacterium]
MENKIFEKYSNIVDKYSDLILKAERYIFANPETGFKEYKTSKYMEDAFEALGYTIHRAEGITGFYTDIDTGRPGPKVLIFGELDSVICAEHPEADKETGAVHSCGHNCQCAALLGIAAALKTPGALDGLSGSVKLCAVPAEELLETEYREELRKKGIIKYYGGKVEFMSRGYFDDCDLAFMVHTTSVEGSHCLLVRKGSNGCISKNVVYKGVAAHAGGAPNNGINALYAANMGFNAVNALRETMVDGQYVRIHSIITNGGQMVNAIPSEIAVETQVRGMSNDIIKMANDKVNRAYAAAAASIGAKVEIHDRPGYSPVENDDTMIEIFEKVANMCTTPDKIKINNVRGGGCSDIGDIQMVMPAIHPNVSGATGKGHGSNYYITDPESACVFSAKFQLVYLHELLKDDAKEAKRVIANAKTPYKSMEEYFAAIDAFCKDREAVIYEEDGTVTLDI